MPDLHVEQIVAYLCTQVGENPHRPGLQETPRRFAAAWQFWNSGYGKDPADVFKAFEDGAEGCDEMVLLTNIPVWSLCEHHMSPFWGLAHIAYVPKGKVLGLSKFDRVVEIFARRLQVQERLTNQIADAFVEHLDPQGVGVVLQCRHSCMESRGVRVQGTVTTTSALRGCIKKEDSARSEFLRLIELGRNGVTV